MKIRKRKSSTKNIENEPKKEITVALLGNPNVGKSTLFNLLTGMNQHTGNWTGKTVGSAIGYHQTENTTLRIVDLPGTYSLTPHSAEEELTEEFISSGNADMIAVVCDAGCLERNLLLVLAAMRRSNKVVVCLNLIDEAEKMGVEIDAPLLSNLLGVPVVPMSAAKRIGINDAISLFCSSENIASKNDLFQSNALSDSEIARKIASDVTKKHPTKAEKRQRCIDRIVCGKLTGFPIMLLLLSVVFWLTMVGANYPSEMLSSFFSFLGSEILMFLEHIGTPRALTSFLVSGIYGTMTTVIAVMLPPMAIFFPLFSILEDLGYLPRVAFNLDKCFKRCDACGKQALTMCMGFGCNAVGIVGCRIIDSKRERLIAMMTNVFVPCNGRLPTLITLISLFLVGVGGALGGIISALWLAFFIVLGVILTFITSKILSKTVLKGTPSTFALELPPYRRPQISRVIIRSVLEKTLRILCRAVAVAAPAGAVIWLLANLNIGNTSILCKLADIIDPFASIFGLDGVILLSFILALPANEILLPIIIMGYSASGSPMSDYSISELSLILRNNGWSWITALCVIVFTLCHFPCSTTLLTIKKESRNLFFTVLSALLPTVIGLIICLIISQLTSLVF